MEQIPLTELKLPKSGYTVKIAKYLTIGQSRDLQRHMFKDGQYDIEAGKLKDLPVDAFLDMQDRAAEFLIKEVINKENQSQPYTQEWLYNLPIEDGNLLYNEINKVTSASNLSEEDKKK